ncbi:MAG TPA: AI-2E family transporter [Lacipirellulaceae bacterium]|nr:AI-2E family transporter [Lacipirellulaceae bacterium]
MTQKPRSSSALFTLVALVTAVAALHFAREILLPIAMAILVSFLLAPLADRLERWKLARIPSVLAVVTVAFLVLGALGWVVTSQLVDLSAQLPQYRQNIIAKVRSVTQGSSALKKVAETIEDVQAELSAEENGKGAPQAGGEGGAPAPPAGQEEPPANQDALAADAPTGDQPAPAGQAEAAPGGQSAEGSNEQASAASLRAWLWGNQQQEIPQGQSDAVEVKVVSLPPSPLDQVSGWLGPLMAPLTGAGMVVVLVLFMLLQREDQRNRLIRLFGANNIHATTEALTDIVERVSKYLRMQFLINAGYGLCVGTGLALIGLPNAVMFGVMSFSLRFLPYIGPWISAALPVAVSLAITEGWTQVGMVIGLFVALELVVNNVAEPLLYGSSTGVSGMGVIVAAIFWTWVWGAIGLVLAMPLTVCLVVMARYIPALRFITVMLGDQPTLTLEERIYQRMLALDDDEVRELTEKYLAHSTTVEFYDCVLSPALLLAERDRMGGLLTDDQQHAVQEVARELIHDVVPAVMAAKLAKEGADATAETRGKALANALAEPRARVLCIPLRDESDATTGLMLKQLLEPHDIETIVGPIEALTSERVESVAALDVDLVVVSVLPPLPQRDSRLLCRRLRKRYPLLPIIVGYWDAAAKEDAHPLLAATGDAQIVTTLEAAVDRARAVASRAPAHEAPRAAVGVAAAAS